MDLIYLGIVIFLCVLAVFDLIVGVSNDAVNFVNSAIGAKAAQYKTIIIIASIGVFAGAASSNGMMDVARHGIFSPQYFSFYEVMCIFLCVMVTDVILLDIFNTFGMPTSTTVSMVFELLGGAFALAIIKIAHGVTNAEGVFLSIGDLLNTDKALSVILAIFLSVAVAFLFGTIVMWLSRLVFTFVEPQNRSLKTILFGGLSATSIIWFLLIKGLKGSTLMTPVLKQSINENTWIILSVCLAVMVCVMAILSLLKVNILQVVVLMGTFALAMAFAGNDLVNFVGVPLTGIDSYVEWQKAGGGDVNTFSMEALQQTAHTPILFLLIAGTIMVLSLIFSKKAKNVVKTSVDLSSQSDGEEMFGSSAAARSLVRLSAKISNALAPLVPHSVSRWIDKRFQKVETSRDNNTAFDMVRASVNLVLAGLLVALGTSFKLPLSTTYVTFMVAMGASLADRAWTRESAVFRITGVLSVIGGWFITAGAAFFSCALITTAMYFGGYTVMFIAIIIVLTIIIRSNLNYKEKSKEEDIQFQKILSTENQDEIWKLLCDHIRIGNAQRLRFVIDAYRNATDGFLSEKYSSLKKGSHLIEEERIELKKQRRKEIIAMRKLKPMTIIPRNTWYFLGINSCHQMLYGLKRINEPIRNHVGNNFSPMPDTYKRRFTDMRDNVISVYERCYEMLQSGDFTDAEKLRDDSMALQREISSDRKELLDTMQNSGDNLNTMLLTVHILQESQELIGSLRHMIRGMNKFAGNMN